MLSSSKNLHAYATFKSCKKYLLGPWTNSSLLRGVSIPLSSILPSTWSDLNECLVCVTDLSFLTSMMLLLLMLLLLMMLLSLILFTDLSWLKCYPDVYLFWDNFFFCIIWDIISYDFIWSCYGAWSFFIMLSLYYLFDSLSSTIFWSHITCCVRIYIFWFLRMILRWYLKFLIMKWHFIFIWWLTFFDLTLKSVLSSLSSLMSSLLKFVPVFLFPWSKEIGYLVLA